MSLSSLRAISLTLSLASLPACSTDDNADATPGCLAGNRSQCVSQVALGDHFGCARLHDRTVWCWGANDESQLGYATVDLCPQALPNGQTRSSACHLYPFKVVGLDGAAQIAVGQKFACAVKTDQTVMCWGDNAAGQLGNGDTKSSLSPVAVAGIGKVTAIALGARHACALSDGNVVCWGADDALQAGAANPSHACSVSGAMIGCETSPHLVSGVHNVTSLAAGAVHTCAVSDDGSVACWGGNQLGQLGTGAASDTPSAMPQPVHAGPLTQFAKSISAGTFHTCTLREDGAVFCWGRNDHGELGVLPTMMTPDHCLFACSPTPLLVAGLPDAPRNWDGTASKEVPDLAMNTLVDLRMTETDAGMTDMQSPPDLAAVPVMAQPSPPRSIAAGGSHTCAQLLDGTVRCWGVDGDGELGDGRRTNFPVPPVVVIAQPGASAGNSLGGVTQVAAGAATTCARVSDGSLRCWGSNELGALGDGDLSTQLGPVPVVW